MVLTQQGDLLALENKIKSIETKLAKDVQAEQAKAAKIRETVRLRVEAIQKQEIHNILAAQLRADAKTKAIQKAFIEDRHFMEKDLKSFMDKLSDNVSVIRKQAQHLFDKLTEILWARYNAMTSGIYPPSTSSSVSATPSVSAKATPSVSVSASLTATKCPLTPSPKA